MRLLRAACWAIAACGFTASASAQIDISPSGVALTDQTGVSGPTNVGEVTAPDRTAMTRFDLASSGLSSITQIILSDPADGKGSPGRISGSDLDGLIVSNDLIGSAFDVGSLTVLDISADIMAAVFTQGSQIAPVDPLLFGTSALDTIDHSVATLNAMDANGLNPTYDGFLSLGEGGELVITLTTPIDPSVHQYIYLGEVGGNQEVASVAVVPEPHTAALALALGATSGLLLVRRRRC